MAKAARKRGAASAAKSNQSAVQKKIGKKKGPQDGRAAKKKGVALASTKHEEIRIGLQKKSRPPRVFVTGASNTFNVYGDSIGFHAVSRKKVTLHASSHTWVNPPTSIA